MTDNRIEKIRAEIERLKHQSVIDSDRQAERGLQSASMASFGKVKACEELLSFIDSMQKELKECMYSTANYTNGDRLTLCKDCKELCRYNQKTAAESLGISQEAYDEIVDKCLYSSEVELVNNGDLPKEEPVSEDLETEIERVRKHHFINDDFDKAELDGRTISNIARHFANWQKSK